jgi:hypothetical protein
MTPKNGSEFVGEFTSTSEEITYTYQKNKHPKMAVRLLVSLRRPLKRSPTRTKTPMVSQCNQKKHPKMAVSLLVRFASTYMYEEITYTHMARDATQQGLHANSLANSLPN